MHPDLETVRDYFLALSAGDFDAAFERVSEDVVWHIDATHPLAGDVRGKPALRRRLAEFGERSGGTVRLDLKDVMGNGAFVALTIHFSAQREGRSMSMDGVDLFRMEGGKVAEIWLFSADQDEEDRFWS